MKYLEQRSPAPKILVIIVLGMTMGCGGYGDQTVRDSEHIPLFRSLSPEMTNIDFENELVEGPNTNVLMYEYFYNGGGVATGDFNGDGLTDIYFTSNMTDNALYINRGDWRFQEVATAGNAQGRPGPWKTGVSLVDINGDNRLDLYLSYSGAMPENKRVNQLLVNQGNSKDGIPVFRDMAAIYGLATPAFSNQAYFLDFDRDGDLDMLLLNHNPQSLPVLNEASTRSMLKEDDPYRGLRLFEQDQGMFTDVTTKVGINGSQLSYGLGLGIADLNLDGWPDFYVCNDYDIPDYLYINNRDGTFSDQLQKSLGHNSHFSMGNDIVDINNDGFQDIISLDMLPEDNRRQKLLMSPDNYSKFDLNLRSGFHYQYMRNMLQLNNGNGTFSEVGQLGGISNTDWSWAALSADYDNDAYKDLFVTNGYIRDYTNLDFIRYMDDYVENKGRLVREEVMVLIEHMPSSNVHNYLFRNLGGILFEDVSRPWGVDQPANSNGAAYADLDNDGDLDLVVNNINKAASIYENTIDQLGNHYLQVDLKGSGQNTLGIGSKVCIYYDDQLQCLEQHLSRGYLSAISPRLHFGLGSQEAVDSLVIIWSGGARQVLEDVEVDQKVTLKEEDAHSFVSEERTLDPVFRKSDSPLLFLHEGSSVRDFDRQTLLPHELSHQGPCMVKADLDADGMDDVFVGGGYGQPPMVFLQSSSGFRPIESNCFTEDRLHFDTDAVVLDANRDGYPDIYVTSGGYHDFSPEDQLLQDRLYINDGEGNFHRSQLPEMLSSTSSIAVYDVNQDGWEDIFVGGRVVPGRYPEAPQSFLLINDGTGTFQIETKNWSEILEFAGMITDAAWIDLDATGLKELVVVGEWMPIMVYNIDGTNLKDVSSSYFMGEYRGWWNTIGADDVNQDERPDLVVGNFGLNTQFQPTSSEPLEMVYGDFDENGSVDPILCSYIQGVSYPYLTRDELLKQLSYLRSKYTSYESYADQTLDDIFTTDQRANSKTLETNTLKTVLFVSQPGDTFREVELPLEVQYAPIHTITWMDFNRDGSQDLLLCGNDSHAKLRIGKLDANYGVLLKGMGNGEFEYVPQRMSGLNLSGDIRSVVRFSDQFLFSTYGSEIQSYELKQETSDLVN